MENDFNIKNINLVEIKDSKSKISCHGRPTQKDIVAFKNQHNINFVLSLLNNEENPFEIKKFCENNNIKWDLIELTGANFLNKKVNVSIVKKLKEIIEMLKTEEINLFVHCAAGIHRTGTIIYAILRVLGYSKENALETIKAIRKETGEKVGIFRINNTESRLVPYII